jgi:hypothetical protein
MTRRFSLKIHPADEARKDIRSLYQGYCSSPRAGAGTNLLAAFAPSGARSQAHKEGKHKLGELQDDWRGKLGQVRARAWLPA